jgi:hypothetical protein
MNRNQQQAIGPIHDALASKLLGSLLLLAA